MCLCSLRDREGGGRGSRGWMKGCHSMSRVLLCSVVFLLGRSEEDHLRHSRSMPRKLQSAATTSSGTGAVLQQSITSSQPMNAGVHRCAAVAWQHAVRRLQDGCWSRLGVRQLCHSAAAGPQNARTTAAAAAPSTALMFPGQGTQRVGMAADLVEQFPCAKHVMEEVDYALGEHLSRLMTHGPQVKVWWFWECAGCRLQH